MTTDICSPASRLFLLLVLAVFPAAASSAGPDDTTVRQITYDCQEQAAAFTKNMGKPGDKELYQQHLKDCIEIATAKPRLMSSAVATGVTCKAGEHLFTFTNTSTDTVWLGVWDPDSGGGIPAPAYWPNWQLDPGKGNSWCAREHFNGRFMVRARCDTTTGLCEEGNCYKGNYQPSDGMKCNIGVEPTSLAEFNFDSNMDKDVIENGTVIKKAEHPLGVTWYDVSYVDGYNFPIAITSSGTASCAALGEGGLPDCPWPTINGVCLAPYLQYSIDNPWYNFENNYYVLAAKCAYQGKWSDDKAKIIFDDTCGCGNQCTTLQNAKITLPRCENNYTTLLPHPLSNQPVTLSSRGCSPYNKYELPDKNGIKPGEKNWIPTYDTLALNQVICNPLKPKQPGDTCVEWPEIPRDYKKYTTVIHDKVPKAYTWQYHDDDSLTQCATTAGQSFTINIGARPANSHGNAFVLDFRPDTSMHGTITINNDPPQVFVGLPLKRTLKDQDKVTISSQCADNQMISCTATYDKACGLTYPNDNSDCADKLSGFGWAIGASTNKTFQMAPPSPLVCKPQGEKRRKFQITPDQTSGSVVITAPDTAKQTFSFSKGSKPFYLYLDAGYKLTINNECSSTNQVSCTATYDLAKGLVSDNTDPACIEPAKPEDLISGIRWSSGTNRALGFGAPVPRACSPKDKTLSAFTIFAGADFSAIISINGNAGTKFTGGGNPYQLNLRDKDSIGMTIDCMGGATLSCNTTYSASTGLLTLNGGQPVCEKAQNTIGWGKEKNTLRPGKPAADQCK